MGGKSTSTSAARLNQIALQSSSLGLPLSLGWGRGRIKCNLMWYNAFKAISHTTKTSSGKGLGGGSSNTTYTYTASIILGLCDGPINGIVTTYRDTDVLSSLSDAGLSLAFGNKGQSTWGYLTSFFPTQALGYSEIAYLYAQDYPLGDNASLPTHSFEVDFAIQLGGGVHDADPRDIVTDFLTSTSHGVPGWGAGLLGDLSDYSLYCRASNLLLSPTLESQTSASSILTEWMTATNSAIYSSEGVLKIRPYGDTAVTGNGVTWTPNLVPAYDLTESDFSPSDPTVPVGMTISDQSDAANIVQVEFVDRANQYNVAIQPAPDLANIVQYGPRKQDPVSLHCIADATIAQHAGQLLLQRTLYVRDLYDFVLPWNFALLEPTDLVTLTTVSDEMKLTRQLVRITQIDEDADGLLAFIAENVDVGTASAAIYASHSGSGYSANANVAPGSVSSPVIFAAPGGLLGFDPEIWCAAAGQSASWGGCEVWISLDGNEYSQAGIINAPGRYGTLSGALAAGSDPDNTNVAHVDLTPSYGSLIGGTAAAMNAGETLAWINGELIAYENATLTAANKYDLAPLRRGLYGTTIAAHPSGAAFVRCDDALFKFSYAALPVGDLIYVKLPSFNIYGQALESLASVSAYTVALPIPSTRFAAAQAEISNIASDSVLSHGSEKQKAVIDHNALTAEVSAVDNQYVALGSPSSVTGVINAMNNASTALSSYLNGLSPSWTDTTTDTAITAATWNSNWNAAYAALAAASAAITGQPGAPGTNGLPGSNGTNGINAITGFLTNESQTLGADPSGNVGSYVGAGGSFVVYSGATDVSSSFTLSTQANPQGLTVGYSSRTYGVTGGFTAANDVATLTILATGSGSYAGVTVSKVFTLAKSKSGTAGTAGSAGANAKLLFLTCDRQTITYDGTGAINPSSQTTTFIANRQNTGASVSWAASDAAGNPVTYFPIAVSADTFSATMAAADFETARAATLGVIITATLTDGVTISDRISVVRVASGTSGTNGLPGSDGANGASGINGAPGTNGTNGVDGLTALNIHPVGAMTWDGHSLFNTSIANSWTVNGAYSSNVIPGGVALSFQRQNYFGNEDGFFGICQLPSASIDYPKIDGSWRMHQDGSTYTAEAWHANTPVFSEGWDGGNIYSVRYDTNTGVITWYRFNSSGGGGAVATYFAGTGLSFGVMATAARNMSVTNVAFTAAGGTGAAGAVGPPGASGVSPSPSYPAINISGEGTFAYPNPLPLNGGQTLTATAFVNTSVSSGSGTVTMQIQYSLDGGGTWAALASDTENPTSGEPEVVYATGQYTNGSGGRQVVNVRTVISRSGNSVNYSGGIMQPS